MKYGFIEFAVPATSQQFYSWRDRVRDPALTMMLIVLCLIMFVAAPLAALGYNASRAALELLFIAFGFLVVLVSRGRIATTVAALAIISFFTGSFLQLLEPSTPSLILTHAGSLSASIVVGYVVGRAVLAPGVVNLHRILGAILVYLNFGLGFGTAYRLIWDLMPDSLTNIPPGAASSASILYFSLATLTTVGFGDIVPVHPLARSLANLEGIIGQLYPATLLARLITLELEARRR